jgi:hypothetical protein
MDMSQDRRASSPLEIAWFSCHPKVGMPGGRRRTRGEVVIECLILSIFGSLPSSEGGRFVIVSVILHTSSRWPSQLQPDEGLKMRGSGTTPNAQMYHACLGPSSRYDREMPVLPERTRRYSSLSLQIPSWISCRPPHHVAPKPHGS